MKRFRNILVVGGQAEVTHFLLERAVTLVQQNGGRLTVVEAVSGLPNNMPTSLLGASPQELNEHFAQERQKELMQQILPKVGGGTPHDVAVLVGKPFVEIIKAVLRHKYDLVMMTAEGCGGLKGKLFGSTALHLMRKCPCPVWIMNPSQQKRISGILAAVDPDPEDEPKHALNIKIMELATSLAQQEQSKLHVVHIWSPWREPCYVGYTSISDQQVVQMAQELKVHRRRELDELVRGSSLHDLDSQVHFLEGDPDYAISNLVTTLNIELIVIGTLCRTGLPGVLIGNTVENVLEQVNCSVLAVKPEGFTSPVTLQGMRHKDDTFNLPVEE